MVTRKGALKPSDVPIDVLDRLNSGAIETVNLAECLAIDFAILMAQVVPELATVAKSRIQPADGITKRMATAGKLLLEHLIPWVSDNSPNIRRFAIVVRRRASFEVTRPRGVWCAHIPKLKQHPELGLSLLEPVRADVSRYVRDSAGNWLNDAAKSQPEWVKMVCERWQLESNVLETRKLCTRALRSVKT